MPIYTYRCKNENCTNHTDKIVQYENREEPHDCNVCGGEKTMKFENFTPGTKGAAITFSGRGFRGGY